MVLRLPTTRSFERAFAGVPMELRAAVGVYDEAVARYMVYTSAGVAWFGSATTSPPSSACRPPRPFLRPTLSGLVACQSETIIAAPTAEQSS